MKRIRTKNLIRLGAVLTVISPIDIIPDWIPFIGFLDDVGAGVFLVKEIVLVISKYQKR